MGPGGQIDPFGTPGTPSGDPKIDPFWDPFWDPYFGVAGLPEGKITQGDPKRGHFWTPHFGHFGLRGVSKSNGLR